MECGLYKKQKKVSTHYIYKYVVLSWGGVQFKLIVYLLRKLSQIKLINKLKDDEQLEWQQRFCDVVFPLFIIA